MFIKPEKNMESKNILIGNSQIYLQPIVSRQSDYTVATVGGKLIGSKLHRPSVPVSQGTKGQGSSTRFTEDFDDNTVQYFVNY